MGHLGILLVLGSACQVGFSRFDDPAGSVDDLLRRARSAIEEGQLNEALDLATKAVDQDPKNVRARLFRGQVYDRQREYAKSITDFDKAVELDPKVAEAYHLRGQSQFKRGRFKESLADFDKYLEMKPEKRPEHWQRGITCYYAGKFDEGSKQFEGYEKVDTNDVENAVWRYLCMARTEGIDKAQKAMLKIGKDTRVPMMEVYALYCGRAKPEQVLAAVQAGNPAAQDLRMRQFYARLYLGLFYEAAGDKKLAREHIDKAAGEYSVNGYMGDVARVHREVLRKESPKP